MQCFMGWGKKLRFFPHFLPTVVLWISCSVKVYYLVTNTAVNSGRTDDKSWLYHIHFIIYSNMLLKQNSDFIIDMIY